MVLWFYGFVHSISGGREVERFCGVMVLWFRPLHLWTARSRLVSWFRGFVVSSTPSLGRQKANRFHGFVVCGFMVSSTQSLRHRNDDRFHGFVVSWFRPLHLWDIEMAIGFMVSWFHGFMDLSTPSLGHRNDYRFQGFVVS